MKRKSIFIFEFLKKRMMKSKIIFILALILLIALIALIGFFKISHQEQSRICIKERCFYVKLAVTQAEQDRGLMFRRYLGRDEGMLFIFNEESVHPFWMKNVILPLDIIWLNKEHEVVFISKNAQPCINDFCEDINPNKNSSYALEFNSGIADEIGLNFGDKIMFDIS